MDRFKSILTSFKTTLSIPQSAATKLTKHLLASAAVASFLYATYKVWFKTPGTGDPILPIDQILNPSNYTPLVFTLISLIFIGTLIGAYKILSKTGPKSLANKTTKTVWYTAIIASVITIISYQTSDFLLTQLGHNWNLEPELFKLLTVLILFFSMFLIVNPTVIFKVDIEGLVILAILAFPLLGFFSVLFYVIPLIVRNLVGLKRALAEFIYSLSERTQKIIRIVLITLIALFVSALLIILFANLDPLFANLLDTIAKIFVPLKPLARFVVNFIFFFILYVFAAFFIVNTPAELLLFYNPKKTPSDQKKTKPPLLLTKAIYAVYILILPIIIMAVYLLNQTISFIKYSTPKILEMYEFNNLYSLIEHGLMETIYTHIISFLLLIGLYTLFFRFNTSKHRRIILATVSTIGIELVWIIALAVYKLKIYISTYGLTPSRIVIAQFYVLLFAITAVSIFTFIKLIVNKAPKTYTNIVNPVTLKAALIGLVGIPLIISTPHTLLSVKNLAKKDAAASNAKTHHLQEVLTNAPQYVGLYHYTYSKVSNNLDPTTSKIIGEISAQILQHLKDQQPNLLETNLIRTKQIYYLKKSIKIAGISQDSQYNSTKQLALSTLNYTSQEIDLTCQLTSNFYFNACPISAMVLCWPKDIKKDTPQNNPKGAPPIPFTELIDTSAQNKAPIVGVTVTSLTAAPKSQSKVVATHRIPFISPDELFCNNSTW